MDISEGIDPIKSSGSKECMVHNLCNRCHDLQLRHCY